MQRKLFLKGFGKGLALDLLIVVFLSIPEIFRVYDGNSVQNGFVTRILVWLLALVTVSYFVSRYKQPKWWMILAIFLSIFVLPFLFGSIALQKMNKSDL